MSEIDWGRAYEQVKELEPEARATCESFRESHPSVQPRVLFVDFPPRLELHVTIRPDDPRRAEFVDELGRPSAAHITPEEKVLCGELALRVHVDHGLRVWRECVREPQHELIYTFKPDYKQWEIEDD